MRKILLSVALSGLVAGQSLAGGLSPVVVDEVPIAVTKPASSVSPLLILGLLVLIGVLISRDDDEEEVTISDIRLKTDVVHVGTAANGLPLYQYRYVGQSQLYQGVMAQDVLMARPDAVVDLPFGYMGVNYGMLGMQLKEIN